jgi:rod shape-determining protein MreC
VVLVDRGTGSGVQRGMAVVTPDGIVGKVIASYPTASQVLLITDGDFAAGVITQKGVRGTLKGQGTPQCKVDYVAFEEKIDPGELLFTSGDDRIFPRGFPVGVIKAVRPGQPFKEILVDPSGLQRGLEDVLILIEGVHQVVPEAAPTSTQPVYIAPPPPGSENKPADAGAAPNPVGTEADRLRTQYQQLGEEQKHKFGENPPGTKPVDFTKLGGRGATPAAQTPNAQPPNTQTPATQPPAVGAPAPAAKPPVKPEVKTENKPEAKPETKPAVPPASRPVVPASPLPPGRGAGGPDAARRTNQNAGVPPGGQLPE